MKNKLMTTIVAFLALAFAPIAFAQSLLPEKSAAVERAEKVAQDIPQTIGYLENKLNSFYRAATVKGEEQAFFDAYGNKAVQALLWYKDTREFVLKIKPTANIPAPNDKVFVPQADGTVKYVAPPEPEKPTPPTPPAP